MKKNLNGKKVKQTAFATAAIAATIVPAVTTIFTISKEDLRKANRAVKQAANALQQNNPAPVTQMDDYTYTILQKRLNNGSMDAASLTDAQMQQIIDYESAHTQSEIEQNLQYYGSYNPTLISQLDFDNIKQTIDAYKAQHQNSNFQSSSQNILSSSSSWLKPLNDLPKTVNVSRQDAANITNQVNNMFRSMTVSGSFSGSVSGGDATLHLSSGLLKPSSLDSLFNTLTQWFSTSQQELENKFEVYYTIGNSQTKHYMVQNGQGWGNNSWVLGPEFKAQAANGQIPDLHFFGVINDQTRMEMHNYGITYDVNGGTQPNSIFRGLTDFQQYATGHGPVTNTGSSTTSTNNTHSSASAIKVGSLIKSGYSTDSENVSAKQILENELQRVLNGATFKGNTNNTTVTFSSPFNQGILNASNALRNPNDTAGYYKDNSPVQMFYTIGNSNTLHQITTNNIVITGADAFVHNANGNGIPEMHFFLGVDKNANTTNSNSGNLVGWVNGKTEDVDIAGVQKTLTFKDSNGLSDGKIAPVKDVVQNVDAPQFKDETLDSRTTIENPELGLIAMELVGGKAAHKPIVKYEYRLKGSNTNWQTQSNFFGAGHPGSTSGVFNGIEWRATAINNAEIINGFTKVPAGARYDAASHAIIGEMTPAKPALTQVLTPTVGGADDSHYFLSNLTPGIKYQFTISKPNSSGGNDPINWLDPVTHKPNPNDASPKSVDEIKDLNARDLLPSLFNEQTGKFYTIDYAVYDDHFDFSKILQPGQSLGGVLNNEPHMLVGSIHLTANDLPDATRHAKLQTFVSPAISSSSTDTGHIKIDLPQFSPMNFKYSIDGVNWDLKLDSNGILVHADGSAVNAWNGASKANVQWKVDDQKPVKDGQFVDYVGPKTPAALTGSLDLDKVPSANNTTVAIPKLITDIKTTGSTSDKPGLAQSNSTSIFDLIADTQFQIPFEYSIDGKTWVSRADFLKTSVNGSVQNFNAAFGGSRNLFDGTKNRPILVRTKPQASLNDVEKYVLDQAVLTKLGWTKDADGTYHSSIDTTALSHAINSNVFETASNVPTVTGASTTNYNIVVPTLANVTYQFKLQTEDDTKWTDAADFKTKHTNIATTNAQGKTIPATIVWRAVAATGYSFADSSKPIHDKNWIEASAGKFNPQTLALPNTMVANIPHNVVAPTLAAGSTNTSNVRISSQPEQGMAFEYSVDGGTNWIKLTNPIEAIPQANLLDAKGQKVAEILWKASFTSPHIAAPNATVSGTIAGWNAVKIAVSQAPAITAAMFTGSDTKNWTFNDTLLRVPGLVYEVTIDGHKYTLDQLKAEAGKLNLFDEATKQFKNISWTVSVAQGYEFVGTITKSGAFKINLPKFISSYIAPEITGTLSSAWNFDVKQDSSSIEFKYSTDGKTWLSQADFMSAHTNLYDVTTNNMIEVHYQANVKTGYVLDILKAKEGIIKLPDATKMVRDGGVVVAPAITGTNTTDYTLTSNVGSQYDIKYSTNQNGPWQTADEFKNSHPNLWQTPGTMTPIYYTIVSKPGFNFHASANTSQNVISTSSLAVVIDESKITAPVFSGVSSLITDSSITQASRHKFAGVDYVFGTDANITASTGLTWENFVKAHPNIYDATTDKTLSIYWLPVATTQNGKPTTFIKAPTAQQLTLPNVTKVISVVSTPALNSATNKTDDYSVVFSDKHLVVKIGTQAPGEDIAAFKAHTPNLFDGTHTTQLKWFISAEQGYSIASGVATSGTFTYAFDKVFESISAPTFKSNNATGFEFTIPQVTGIDYKFYVGSDVSHAVDYQTFKQNGLSSIFDSTANKYKEVHWVATAQTGYAIKANVVSTGLIDFAMAKAVISDVKPPVFDATKTTDSANWTLTQPDPKDTVTQYKVAGSSSWIDLAGLTRLISSTYHGNLWDRTTDKFLDIEWKISPKDTSAIFEPGTVTSGHLDMQKMSDGNPMLKFIPIESHEPRISATSKDTAHLAIENLDPLLDYKFAIEGNTDFKSWTDFIAANSNLYNSLTGVLPNIVWTATAKPGYRTEIHSVASQNSQKTNTVIAVSAPKFIDKMNDLTMTGTSTSQFAFNGSTNGASYVVSTSKTGTFIPLADFIKQGNFATNGAKPELWYKVVSTDAAKYVVDPSLEARKLDTTSLSIALSSPTAPLISTTAGENISNSFKLNQTSLSQNVDYLFELPNLAKGTWMTVEDLIKNYGNKIYNPITDAFEVIMWKASPKTGYVWDSKQQINAEGQLSTGRLVKYVADVNKLDISWAASTVHKSDNYIWENTMQDKGITYEFSTDGHTWHPLINYRRPNLYDSTTGSLKNVQWRAHVAKDANNDGLHTGSSASDYWTGTVDLSSIAVKVIDNVVVPKIAGANGGKLTSVVANDAMTASQPHVTYLFADKTAGDAKLLSFSDFLAAHSNVFNSQTFNFDQVVWGVKAESGFEFSSSITNTEAAGVQTALNLDLTGMVGVITSIPKPTLGGTAQHWNVQSTNTVAYTYTFKVNGITDASNTFKSLADLQKAYPSLSIGGVNHGIDWEATPTSSTYEFAAGVEKSGTLTALTDNLEIAKVAKPVINFTDSHSFSIDKSLFTSNIIYKFRVEGSQAWMDADTFTNGRNLYVPAIDAMQKIEWQALPDTSNANAVFHFASTVTKTDSEGVITPNTNKYLGKIIAPSLVNASAKSTDLAFITLSNHVSYDFMVDGTLVTSGNSFTTALKEAYAKAILTNQHHDPAITWTAKADNGYAIDQSLTSGTVDTSNVIKVVSPKPVLLDANSKNTSDYLISSETKAVADYEISLDGGHTWEKMSADFGKHHPLFTIDGGLKVMNWRAVAETGYAFDSQPDHGTVDLSSLKKVLDNLPLPSLNGTTSANWSIDIDSKYKAYFDYEYSLDGGKTFVNSTDFKAQIAKGINLYDAATGVFKQITVHSVVDSTKFDYAPGVNARTSAITTDKLIGIIDNVIAPVLDSKSADSADYTINETQPNVKYEYWVEGSKHFASISELKQSIGNLYVFKNNAWVMQDIHWSAAAASNKFELPSTTTHEGVISMQSLIKVIDLSPTLAATGTSINFAIEDSASHKEFSIPGLTIKYKIGADEFSNIADFFKANPTFNLFDDSKDSWKIISFEIADITGYKFTGQATGNVDTSNLKRIIASFDNNWKPELTSGSTQWNYSFAADPLPTSLAGKLIYQFATSANAPESEWKTEAGFKAANPTLLNTDQTNKQVFWRVIVDPSQASKIEFGQSVVHSGEVTLPLATVITKVEAPEPKAGGNSLKFELTAPTQHVQYLFSLTPTGQYVDLLTLLNQNVNLYDAANNTWKHLYYQAAPETGYTFAQGQEFKGEVNLSGSNLLKVIDSYVAPVLVAADSMHYSLVAPQGQTLTQGLEYDLSVVLADGRILSMKPSDLMNSGINLFDQTTGKMLEVKYEVFSADSTHYSLMTQNNEGPLTIPTTMKNVVQSVTAPTFTSTSTSTENWDLTLQGEKGFHFEFEVAGKHYKTIADLKAGIAHQNLFINNNLQNISWTAIADTNTVFAQGVTISGTITTPTTFTKMLDAVAIPQITGQTSTAYGISAQTPHVSYEFKLVSEDDTKWTSSSSFVTAHHNIFNETSGKMFVIQWRAVAEQGFDFSTSVDASHKAGQITPAVTPIIETVSPVTFMASGTTKQYAFDIPSSSLVDYLFSTSENGQFVRADQFLQDPANANLYSASSNTLKGVWWKAVPKLSTMQIASTTVSKLEIANESSLIKVVEIDSLKPSFSLNSGTTRFNIDVPSSQVWNDHYEFRMEGETSYTDLATFLSTHKDITAAKQNGLHIEWQSVYKTGFVADTGINTNGQMDMSSLQTQISTANVHLDQIQIKPNTSAYEFLNLPTIQAADGYRLVIKWGDEQKWISATDAEWPFSYVNPQLQLWDNNFANPDHSFGAWKHGGSITFKLEPLDPANILTNDQETTIDFNTTNNGQPLVKIINNSRLASTSDVYDSQTDRLVGFVPGFGKVDSALFGGQVNGANSKSVSLAALEEHSLVQKHTMTFVNPFVGMIDSERDSLVDSISDESYAALQPKIQALINAKLLPNGFDKSQLIAFLKSRTPDESYFEPFMFNLVIELLGNIWDGSNWSINEIDAKQFAVDGDVNTTSLLTTESSKMYQLENQASRIIWTPTMNTIAKIVDNQSIIDLAQKVIIPGADSSSLNDNIIWGNENAIDDLIQQAANKGLMVELSMDEDTTSRLWYGLFDENDPKDFRNMYKKISSVHGNRHLYLRVVSTETDDAMNNDPVKVTNEQTFDITTSSKIQQVKTHWDEKAIDTKDVVFSGTTLDPIIDISKLDLSKDLNPATPEIDQLEMTFQNPENPNQWMPLADFISYMKMKARLGQSISGEDIKVKFDVPQSLSNLYAISKPIIGSVDYSKLYEFIDINDYIEALKNIQMEGIPSTDLTNKDRTVYIATDSANGALLASDEFRKQFGIQYQVTNVDGTKGPWQLFSPEMKDLEPDFAHNVLAHPAGTYMNISLLPDQEVSFRIIPIATIKHDVKVSKTNEGISQQEALELTRILTSDYNQLIPDSQGTIVTIKASDILSSGEHMLDQWITDNATESLRLENIDNKVADKQRIIDELTAKIEALKLSNPSDPAIIREQARLDAEKKALNDLNTSALKDKTINSSWIDPFLNLVSSRPKFEEIKDEFIDPELLAAGKLIPNIVDVKVIDDLVSRGIIDQADKVKILEAIGSFNDNTKLAQLQAQNTPEAKEELTTLTAQIYQFIIRMGADASMENVISLKTTQTTERLRFDGSVELDANGNPIMVSSEVFVPSILLELLKAMRQEKIEAIRTSKGDANWTPSASEEDVKLVSISRLELIQTILNGPSAAIKKAVEDAISKNNNVNISVDFKKLADLIQTDYLQTSIPTSQEVIMRLYAEQEKDLIARLLTVDNTHVSDVQYNRDIDAEAHHVFEISQIGNGAVDAYGQKFTHSNTIFFGNNAIRFNIEEDPKTEEKHIVDAYLVAEDSQVSERIAHIHLSNLYSLEDMSLVLELENGDTVFLEKQITSSAMATVGQELIRFVRLENKKAQDGTLLDMSQNGAIWKHYSETIINNQETKVVDDSTKIETIDILGQHLKTQAAEIQRQWVATQAELDARTGNNELPFNLSQFDNRENEPSAIDAIDLGIQTPWDIQTAKAITAPASNIYGSPAGAKPLANGNGVQVTGFDPVNNFNKDETTVYKVYHSTVNSEGYVVIEKIADDGSFEGGKVMIQNAKEIRVSIIDENGQSDASSNGDKSSFPVWAIVLSSIGGAGALGGAGYLGYNKIKAKKAGIIKKPKI